jgi:hypothetical protein
MIRFPANAENGAAGIASGAVVSAEKCDALLRAALAARRRCPANYPAARRAYLRAARERRVAFNGSNTAHAGRVQYAPGKIHAPVGQLRMKTIRNNKVIGGPDNKVIGGPDNKVIGGPDNKVIGGPDNNVIVHVASTSAARHRAAIAHAQAKLTGWTRDLYRAVTVYARSIDKARERAAHGMTDGVCRDDHVSYRRIRHAPASAVNDIHSGSNGLATTPDRMASRIAKPATVRAKHGLARVADPRAIMGDGRYHVSIPVIDPAHAARRLTKRERNKIKR